MDPGYSMYKMNFKADGSLELDLVAETQEAEDIEENGLTVEGLEVAESEPKEIFPFLRKVPSGIHQVIFTPFIYKHYKGNYYLIADDWEIYNKDKTGDIAFVSFYSWEEDFKKTQSFMEYFEGDMEKLQKNNIFHIVTLKQ